MAEGLPLLSGPLPQNRGGADPIACRKCNKEFTIFTRHRRCNHCGYMYCLNCTDYQALMPRSNADARGYDSTNVCGFCIELLSITASGRGQLKTLPLSKLKKYVAAYNIKIDRAVEKDDLIDAIVNARGRNGCLPPENERHYRTYSVPDRTDYNRPRGLFSRGSNAAAPPPTPPRPAPPPRQEFARPDLAPDDPPPPPPPREQYRYAPPPGPPPQMPPRPQQQQPFPQYQSTPAPHPPPRPHHYASQPPHPSYSHPHTYSPPQAPRPNAPRGRPNAPPMPPHASRPTQQSGPYQRPAASRSSQNLNADNAGNAHPSSRPRSTSAAPPAAPSTPTLDELVAMNADSVKGLSVGTLKAVLFSNHVNAGMILEKAELVKKVIDLIDDEKRDRERQRLLEEQEEQERIARQHEMMAEFERQQRLREQQQQSSDDASVADGENAAANGATTTPSTSPPPPPMPHPKPIERTGLCVVCQDEEANIAIVDCGHLAMCRGCSDLIMNSSRECPLCRTRIVTEQRLLRIFKT